MSAGHRGLPSQVSSSVYYTECSRGTIEGFWGVTYPVFFFKKRFCVENGLKKARIGSWAITFWYYILPVLF